MRRRPPLALLLLSGLAFSSPSRAAPRCGSAYVGTCIDSDTLWPHAGPSQLVSVGGTETTTRGQFGFGLVTSYLSRPITWRLPSPGGGGSDAFAVDNQVNATFLWSYGVTDRLELGLMMPVTLGQSGAGVAPITGGASLKDTATRDLRFGVAWAVVPHPRLAPERSPSGWGLTARFETSAPTGDDDQFAGQKSAVFAPSLAADARWARFFAGAEAGARLRPVTELVGARVGSQLVFAIGAGFDLLRQRELLAVALEARALPVLSEQHDSVQTHLGLQSVPNGKTIVPAEWSLSARTAPLAGGDFAIQLAGGGALSPDVPVTTPRMRFTLSLRYAPLGRDSDGDGVLDKDDLCPTVRGSRASRGCEPDKPLSPPAFPLRPGSLDCDEDPESVDVLREDACPERAR